MPYRMIIVMQQANILEQTIYDHRGAVVDVSANL